MDCSITFLPEAREWRGPAGTPLSVAAAACDIVLEQPCGGRTGCGRCRVRVRVPAAADAAEVRVLGDAAVTAGWRLGCRLDVAADAIIEVPWSARVVAHKSFGGEALFAPGFAGARTGWGVALDVGSTTLAAAVIALESGSVVGSATALNRQVSFGADVMSRIAHARSHSSGAAALHAALVGGVNEVVERAAASAGVDVASIEVLVAVGNPTMLHALRSLPLDSLGVAPYEGVEYGEWTGAADSLGIALPGARAHLLPGIRSHVGADAVACMLAARLDQAGAPTLLLDLGTNTEVMLATADAMLCTTAAAGPAFEGASIRCGVRAVSGAIEHVRITSDGALLTHTIDDAPAIGICGSGLADAVAELLRAGVIECSGRVRRADEIASASLATRIDAVDGARAIRLAGNVRLHAQDVRELQLARAGIAAAVQLLLAEAGVVVSDLDRVLVAGGFGNYVRGGSALAIGLLPPVAAERIEFIGNAAGAGARLALVDPLARERALHIASVTRFVPLGGRADYEDAFVALLPFPELI